MQVSKYDWSGERTRREAHLKWLFGLLIVAVLVAAALMFGWEFMGLDRRL